jgi:CHAT domain-containing protein
VSEIQNEGRFLYSQLLAPLPGAVPSKGVTTVLPDAEIAALPFHLLVDQQGRWLDESSTIEFATHPGRANAHWTQPKQALVIGSPATQEPLPTLPDSAAEAESVRASFPGSTVLTGKDATLSAVMERLQQADLFHFSGHGYAGASVGGLYLADSLLTSVSLQHASLPACRLAVLSACLTAMGQTKGLSNPDSFVHALLDAGAQTVIASRWSVDSEATTALMSLFYRDLHANHDPAQSLRHASEQLRAYPQYAHPYYWGAFQTYE